MRSAATIKVLGSALWALAFAPGAFADDIRVDKGRELAQLWCASCHVTSANQLTGADQAPAFQEIANDRTKTDKKLRVFLLDPHGGMPPLNLSREETNSVIAYINSMRPQKNQNPDPPDDYPDPDGPSTSG